MIEEAIEHNNPVRNVIAVPVQRILRVG